MSYYNGYVIFDPKKANQKPIINDATPDEDRFKLIEAYIKSGTIHSYFPDDNRDVFGWALPGIASVHDIEFDGYLTAEQIKQLLSILDGSKVKTLLPDAKAAKVEALQQIDIFTVAVKDALDGGALDEGEIDISPWDRYSVPLFEAHGIVMYSKLNKEKAEALIANLNDAAIYAAVDKASFSEELGKEEQRILIETLTNLKEIYNKLTEFPESVLFFYDDYNQEYLPREQLNRILQS